MRALLVALTLGILPGSADSDRPVAEMHLAYSRMIVGRWDRVGNHAVWVEFLRGGRFISLDPDFGADDPPHAGTYRLQGHVLFDDLVGPGPVLGYGIVELSQRELVLRRRGKSYHYQRR
jgi:hypothetical protein